MSVKATILLFHRVSPVRDKLWDPMDPILFEKVMRYISKNYYVVSLKRLLTEDIKTSKPLAAITFDDGYKDFIEFAYPVLAKYNLPSSMYVVTDSINSNTPTWTYIMDYLFFNTSILSIPPKDYGDGCEKYNVYKWATKKEQINYCSIFKQHLKRVESSRRTQIIDHFIASINDVKLPHNMMMNWDDINFILKNGVDVGSHTVTHPPLATISDEMEITHELLESKNEIQSKTGIAPETISYPVGSYDERVKSIARKVGYKYGLAVDQQKYNSSKQDIFQIPRIELYNEPYLKTIARVTGLYGSVKKIIS